MVAFRYNFNNNTAVGLREVILQGFNISPALNVVHPKVVIVSREGDSRDLLNYQAILTHVKNHCPGCEIQSVVFQKLNLERQIQAVAGASVLMGLHGSGLSHVLWLARSRPGFETVLLEIMPYRYICRDWYKVAAEVAGARYFSVMNRGRLLPLIAPGKERQAKFCWSHPEACTTIYCHDFLKNQKFEVELDVFNETWTEVLGILDRNRRAASVLVENQTSGEDGGKF
jgi:hypothetical protein